MDEEPFDELSGPPPITLSKSNAAPPTSAFQTKAAPSGPPPADAFSFSNRWNQHEPDQAESDLATANAVLTAAERSAARQVEDESKPYGFKGSPPDVPRKADGIHTYNWRDISEDESADIEVPYAVHRTASGSIEHGIGERKKRVPAALAGLGMGSRGSRPRPGPGRVSFRDHAHEGNMVDVETDDDVIDVVGMNNRAASGRAMFEENEVEQGPKKPSWSSRYTIDSTLLALSGGLGGKDILDNYDRENERTQMSARNMFASTAYDMKSIAAQEKAKVFGAGFTFRKRHVNGNQDQNLARVWNNVDIDEGSGLPEIPVHKTWQQMLLNKRRRRNALKISFLFCIGLFIMIGIITASQKNESQYMQSKGRDIGRVVTFYVTSDVPYTNESEEHLGKHLRNLPGDAEFVVHLGNIQDATTTMCPSTRYSDVASILVKSPVPMLTIPGAHDWILCPKPEKSLDHWRESFVNLEDQWKHPLPVNRQTEQPENFGFVYNGVLFLGLNLVTGPVWDEDEWATMQMNNIRFMYGMVNANKDNIRSVILLGNARPSPQQDVFFKGVQEMVDNTANVPVAYIHANPGNGEVEQYVPFADNKNILGVQVESGSLNRPLRVNVGFGQRPFLVG
jgi:hypothetical protein